MAYFFVRRPKHLTPGHLAYNSYRRHSRRLGWSFPCPMLEFGQALQVKACPIPQMQALGGRETPALQCGHQRWQQMEAMCSQVAYSALITQRILEKLGF